MVNVQAFVVIVSFCSLFSAVCWILLLVVLNRMDYKIERICNYSMDILGMVTDIKFRCIDFKDDNSSNLVELHRIENKLDDTSNNLRYLINNTVAIKKHTEKIEKNSAIKWKRGKSQ